MIILLSTYNSYPTDPVYPVFEIKTFEFLIIIDLKLNFLIDSKLSLKTSLINFNEFGP